MEWTEAKYYITKITMKHDFGKENIRYAYYESRTNTNNYLTTLEYIKCDSKHCLITFYKEAFDLDKEQLRCVTLHAVGHYKDYKSGSRGNLSEKYANDYMQLNNNNCTQKYSE